MKHTIEFELKDFKCIYNQNKVASGNCSPTYKYGEYTWYLRADVKKYKNQADEDLWFRIYMFCETDNQINFPLFGNAKILVLNKNKDSRKDYSQSN